MKAWTAGIALAIAVLAVGVGSAGAAATGAKPASSESRAASATAPPGCRVFNPLFEWDAGQERSLRAADVPCDAAPGRRAWLVLQRNGNLAFYLDGHQLWDAGVKGKANQLVERSYGGLDLVDGNQQVIWATEAPAAEGFEPHPNGGFGIGFVADSPKATDAYTHWSQDEGLCGEEGGCGQTLWESGKGLLN